jgi:hypothetical protein
VMIGIGYYKGVGPRLGRALRLGSRWFDRWAISLKHDFVWLNGIITRVTGVYVPPPLPFHIKILIAVY